MSQFENTAIERRSWGSADTLRSNGNFASNEHLLPVMGQIFLRHAHSRFLGAKPDESSGLPESFVEDEIDEKADAVFSHLTVSSSLACKHASSTMTRWTNA